MSNQPRRPRNPITREGRAGNDDNAERVFYGLCTYWNDMDAFRRQTHSPRSDEMPFAGRPGDLPRCPFCGSPGFEAPLHDFIRAIDEQSANQTERAAWHWQRGRRCFRSPNTEEARAEMIAAYLLEVAP